MAKYTTARQMDKLESKRRRRRRKRKDDDEEEEEEGKRSSTSGTRRIDQKIRRNIVSERGARKNQWKKTGDLKGRQKMVPRFAPGEK